MSSTLHPGEVFAGYEIQHLLGVGGMGEVYLARDRDLGRSVALKLLTHTAGADAELRNRFEREARTVAQLDHPNIVTVYARGLEDHQLWLAMSYVDGTDVAQELTRTATMEPARAVRIVTEVADALDYANDKGVLHRDVKPANILLARSPRERAVLTDFGIAKVVNESWKLTETSNVVATFQYAAPERFTAPDSVDRRADVYALGCTLYYMLTGELPYPTTDLSQLIYEHIHGAIPQPSARRPELPVEFDAVIATALAKSPDERFATCGQLATAAREALEGRRSAVTVRNPAGQPDGSGKKAAWAPAIVRAVLLLLGIMCGVVTLFCGITGADELGWIGTPGTFTASSCAKDSCAGTFEPDGGGAQQTVTIDTTYSRADSPGVRVNKIDLFFMDSVPANKGHGIGMLVVAGIAAAIAYFFVAAGAVW
ncbi:serine/threonine-protein kinase [Nocardia sp. alder85J]|uniref:serine/threonine-protein kinase n=1 Tax=Nocardia sp. alder85J TaxID=2862949 RepID=UPI001CD4217B|nr:serine/threonine-protein kinase [Nocardia sp. alder85J]MCX4098110.1 serine/threonine-protein kinase [Nocardia sp. alder85J]